MMQRIVVGRKLCGNAAALVGARNAPLTRNLSSADTTSLKSLLGLSVDDLVQELSTFDVGDKKTFKPYHAKQLYQFIYRQGATSIADVTSLTKRQRELLLPVYSLDRGRVIRKQKSADDGTLKFLFGFGSGTGCSSPSGQKALTPVAVETVLIPDRDRNTVCISSQCGCSLSCAFCHTGTQKLTRNLTSGEIIAQVMQVAAALGDFPLKRPGSGDPRMLSNIVLMGQGEPLYNYRNVSKAVKIMLDPLGMAFSKYKITLSTSGVVPLIPKVLDDLDVNLAISLHAVDNDLRSELVPLNKTYPLPSLMAACRDYCRHSNGRKITFEYVMLNGVNDRPQDLRELVRLLKPLSCYVNLIPFNKWPGASFECSPVPRIQAFAKGLTDAGLRVVVRWPRGRDIMAACGQLHSLVTRGDNGTSTSASL